MMYSKALAPTNRQGVEANLKKLRRLLKWSGVPAFFSLLTVSGLILVSITYPIFFPSVQAAPLILGIIIWLLFLLLAEYSSDILKSKGIKPISSLLRQQLYDILDEGDASRRRILYALDSQQPEKWPFENITSLKQLDSWARVLEWAMSGDRIEDHGDVKEFLSQSMPAPIRLEHQFLTGSGEDHRRMLHLVQVWNSVRENQNFSIDERLSLGIGVEALVSTLRDNPDALHDVDFQESMKRLESLSILTSSGLGEEGENRISGPQGFNETQKGKLAIALED